jgi:plastocyanin
MRWLLLLLSLALLAVGITIAVAEVMRARAPSRPTEILRERLARGEISTEEYEQRSNLLADGRSAVIPLTLGAALSVLGLAGLLAFGLVGATGWRMHHMDSMMGRGGMMGMMRGESGRSGSPEAKGAREIRVRASESLFSPSRIEVNKGEKVNVVLDNRGGMFHTLTVSELGFDLRANAGEEIGGSLTVEEEGTYQIVCTVPGHADAGMRGTIEVVPT